MPKSEAKRRRPHVTQCINVRSSLVDRDTTFIGTLMELFGNPNMAELAELVRSGRAAIVYGRTGEARCAVLDMKSVQRTKARACRVCSCTHTNPCVHRDGSTCYWVQKDLCSACVGK